MFEASQVRSELADTSAAFRKALAVAGFAELLRGSRFTEELSFTSLYRLAAGAVSGDKRDQELLGLITKAGELSGETLPVARR